MVSATRKTYMPEECAAQNLPPYAILTRLPEKGRKKCAELRFLMITKLCLKKNALDAVIIATPHYAHAEIAIYAIGKGVPVLIEKPVAVTTKAAKEIMQAAAKNPSVQVGVSFNQRTNRMYKYAKALLDSGELGNIQRINFTVTHWYRSQAYYNQGGWRASFNGEGGGCLINQCVHQLDILNWLSGTPNSITAVAYTKNRDITVENDVSAIFNYDGFDCLFSASTHELKGTNRLEIACDKGKIIIGKAFMRVYRHKTEIEVNANYQIRLRFCPQQIAKKVVGFITGIGDLLYGQQRRSVQAFMSGLRGKGQQLATVWDGLNTLELINGIYLSSWIKEKISLPIDDEKYDKALDEKRKEEALRG